jgi:hypothetical protein
MFFREAFSRPLTLRQAEEKMLTMKTSALLPYSLLLGTMLAGLSFAQASSGQEGPLPIRLAAYVYRVQASKLYPAMGLSVPVPDQIQLMAQGSTNPAKPPLGYSMTLVYQDLSAGGADQTFSCVVAIAGPMCYFNVPDATAIVFKSLQIQEINFTASKMMDLALQPGSE